MSQICVRYVHIIAQKEQHSCPILNDIALFCLVFDTKSRKKSNEGIFFCIYFVKYEFFCTFVEILSLTFDGDKNIHT